MSGRCTFFLNLLLCCAMFPEKTTQQKLLSVGNNINPSVVRTSSETQVSELKISDSEVNSNSTNNGTAIDNEFFSQVTSATYGYIGFNIIFSLWSFSAMKSDKIAAVNNEWRKSEVHLHSLELLGGWIGSLLAQQIYRHKTKKAEYQKVFWFIVILHLGLILLLYYLLSLPPGHVGQL